MATPYDSIPIETRRLNWGWFGDPWPSGICYTDDDQLRADMRKDTPVGEDCLWCDEPIEPGHSGQATPLGTEDGGVTIRHVHKECQLRNTIGPAEHLDGRCACRDIDRPTRTYREEALEVWARMAGERTQP
jgi:hypothetical protein